MNLLQTVFSAIGTVNPNQYVQIQVSVGSTEAPDGSEISAYATPGQITASIGGTFEASIPDPTNPTTLLVSEVIFGSLQPGDAISGSDGTNAIPAGATVLSQLSGAPGGSGTYQTSVGTASGILGSCDVISESTVLNVSAIASGVLQAGQTLADVPAVLLPGTLITGQLQGNAGGPGLYSVSQQQTVAGETMTTALSILAQVQPLAASELRHMDMLNIQGSHRAIYLSGKLAGAVRVALKGGDLVTLADGSKWLVTQPLESFYSTAGWTKCAITMQDGS